MEFGCLRDNNIKAAPFKYLCFSQKDKYYRSMQNKEENKDVLIIYLSLYLELKNILYKDVLIIYLSLYLELLLKFIYNSNVSDSLTSLIYKDINLATTTASC